MHPSPPQRAVSSLLCCQLCCQLCLPAKILYCRRGGGGLPSVPSCPLASQLPTMLPPRAAPGHPAALSPEAHGYTWSPSVCWSLGLPGFLGQWGHALCCVSPACFTSALRCWGCCSTGTLWPWPGRWAGWQQDCPSMPTPGLQWLQGAHSSPATE